MKDSKSFRPQTLRHHQYSFGQEPKGPIDRKTGQRSKAPIPVQPTAVARSNANGTKRRGRRALGTTGAYKDRSGEVTR